MSRKIADCRRFPSEMNCSLTISGEESEVLDEAVEHAVRVHGHAHSPELRRQVSQMLQEEGISPRERVVEVRAEARH